MGRFANETEGQGMRVGPPVVVEGNDGFAAFGKMVPFYRRAAADRQLKAMGVTDTERRMSLVEVLASAVERDEPHAGMERAYAIGLDVTGIYVILSVLCAAEKPRIRVKARTMQ